MKKCHVLIIEDDKETIKLIEYILKPNGYYVSSALDGRKGVAAACSEPPGLILLDYMLPDKDGIAVLNEIRVMPELHRIPVIMITAIHQAQIVKTAIQAGVNDFLIKPFKPDQLLERVKKLLPPDAWKI
jgi:two-component system, sensor histidine kinase and response regulator